MRFYILTLCLLVATATPAGAQQDSNGLSYTTKGARKERTGGHMNYKALDYSKDNKQSLPPLGRYGEKEKDTTPPEDETAAEEAWEKYKELAAGTYKEPAPEKHRKTVPPATIRQGENAGGLNAILEQYQRNKEQRSQMRTLRVTPAPDIKKAEEKAAAEKEEKEKQE